MAYSAPRTWVTGDIISISHLNSYVRDDQKFLYYPPRAKWVSTAAQNLVDSTSTTVTYSTEVFDTDNMLDSAVSVAAIYVNTNGLYLTGAYWQWQIVAGGTGRRIARVYHKWNTLNGLSNDEIAREDFSTDTTNVCFSNASGMDYAVVGDYFTSQGFHTSAATIQILTGAEFWAVWIGG